MTDDRIVRALREGPLDEPIYNSAQLRRTLAAPGRPTTRRGHSAFRLAAGGFQLALAVIVAVVLLAGIVFVREQGRVGTTPSPSVPDLLEQVRRSGVIRFAVRPDFPQATVPGLDGFDIDVGTALATHMGLLDGPVRVAAGDMLAASAGSDWDVAFPSSLLSTDQTAQFTSSLAYYYWPVYLLVPAASTVAAATDLGGKPICVVAGSSGEAWLAGRLPAGATSVVAAPTAPVVRTESADRDCLVDLTSGAVDALVTSTLSDSDLAARPTFRTVGGPLFVEPRTIVASRESPDPSALLSAIDAALGAMRSDGTLADLSRNRFGGRDLSIPPTNP